MVTLCPQEQTWILDEERYERAGLFDCDSEGLSHVSESESQESNDPEEWGEQNEEEAWTKIEAEDVVHTQDEDEEIIEEEEEEATEKVEVVCEDEERILETEIVEVQEEVCETPAQNALGGIWEERCKICLNSPIETVCIPCGHAFMCSKCAALLPRGQEVCSICRHEITLINRLFIA